MQRCRFRPGFYLLNVFLINNPLSQFGVRCGVTPPMSSRGQTTRLNVLPNSFFFLFFGSHSFSDFLKRPLMHDELVV